MTKSTLIPILIFILTVASGTFVIYTSEQTRTEPLTVSTRAAGECGDCPSNPPIDQEVQHTCPDGTVVTCRQIRKWYLDPDDSDHCILCQDDLQCNCPQSSPTPPPPSNTPTNTPPPESPTPTPTLTRADLCVNASANPTALAPGVNTTLSATASEPAKYFSFYFYNNDNEYAVNDPKPMCVPGNGTTPGCPEGHVHLGYIKTLEEMAASTTMQLAYEDIFVPDFHSGWDGSVPASIHVNAYFRREGEGNSIADENCMFDFTIAPTSSPTITPSTTVTPTDTPTPTNTPTGSPTPSSTTSPSVTPTRTPTPTPSLTNTPSPTLTPTSTPIPTLTPLPTNTPLPTDTPVAVSGQPIPSPYCGDGIIQSGEQCDDGNTNNDDSCRNDCTQPEAQQPPTNTQIPELAVEGQKPGITPWIMVLIPIGLVMLGLLF